MPKRLIKRVLVCPCCKKPVRVGLTYRGKRHYEVFHVSNRCSDCGRVMSEDPEDYTEIHHDKYDDANPLAHTRELCRACHVRLTRRQTVIRLDEAIKLILDGHVSVPLARRQSDWRYRPKNVDRIFTPKEAT